MKQKLKGGVITKVCGTCVHFTLRKDAGYGVDLIDDGICGEKVREGYYARCEVTDRFCDRYASRGDGRQVEQ